MNQGKGINHLLNALDYGLNNVNMIYQFSMQLCQLRYGMNNFSDSVMYPLSYFVSVDEKLMFYFWCAVM